jgi:hypothetical protein
VSRMEGDCWEATTGTVHIEKEAITEDALLGIPILSRRYWCGMASQPKHRCVGSVIRGFFITETEVTCRRCNENRDKRQAEARG